MESRTQGSRPRPRTQKKSEAKDSLSGNRHSRGQGQEYSRPRTGMLEAKDQGHKRKCSPKKKKRSSQKFFKRSPQKHVFQKIFQALPKILTIQKIVLSSSRGQANFRGLEASRSRPRTSKCVLEAKDVLEDSTSVIQFRNNENLGQVQHWFSALPNDFNFAPRSCEAGNAPWTHTGFHKTFGTKTFFFGFHFRIRGKSQKF